MGGSSGIYLLQEHFNALTVQVIEKDSRIEKLETENTALRKRIEELEGLCKMSSAKPTPNKTEAILRALKESRWWVDFDGTGKHSMVALEPLRSLGLAQVTAVVFAENLDPVAALHAAYEKARERDDSLPEV